MKVSNDLVNKQTNSLKGILINIIVSLSLAALLFPGCKADNKKYLNERVSLKKKDKIPYGAFVAYDNLRHLFPDAVITSHKGNLYSVDNEYSDETTVVDSAVAAVEEQVTDTATAIEGMDSVVKNSLENAETSVDGTDTDDNSRPDSAYDEENNTAPALEETKKERTAVISLAWYADLDSIESNKVINRAASGDYIFISAYHFSKSLLDSLHLVQYEGNFENKGIKNRNRWKIFDPVSKDTMAYSFPGAMDDGHFSKLDTGYTTILGTDKNGKANFVRIDYVNGGSIFIHLNPLAFSNFFLLHKDNISYYNKALSYIPSDVEYVSWNEYFVDNEKDFSSLGFLWKQKAFRWAIILVVVLCAILFLVESKRRQRIVPVIPPVNNSSVDFVHTIGRLYFQQRDHKNLANKMIAHYLEHVRTTYNISTSVLNEAFIEKLSYKSGFKQEDIRELTVEIKYVEESDAITEEGLMGLSDRIEKLK